MRRICRSLRRSMPMAMADSALAGCRIEARCFAFPMASGPGRSATQTELNEDALAAVFDRAQTLDFFLIGAGRDPWPLPEASAPTLPRSVAIGRYDADRRGRAHLQHSFGGKPPRRRGADRRRLSHALGSSGWTRTTNIARRWCARPTATGISRHCLRRPTGAARCSRCMHSTSKFPASGISRVSRCPVRSGCNGGARCWRASARVKQRQIRSQRPCLRRWRGTA